MENITIRKKMRRSESEKNLYDSSIRSNLLNETLLNTSSLSLHSLSPNSDSSVVELTNELSIIKQKLLSADTEVENLTYENNQLKQTILEQNKQIDLLKKLSQDYNFKLKRTYSTPIAKKLHITMRYPRTSPLHTHSNLLCLSQGNSPISSPISTNHRLKFNKKCDNENPIAHTSIAPLEEIPSLVEMNSSASHMEKNPKATIQLFSQNEDKEEQCNIKVPEYQQVSSLKRRKNRVVIIADGQGRGLRKNLQRLLGSSYIVTSFLKPNALFIDIISSIKSEISDLTDDDCVVLLGGCNDKNPEKLTTELNSFLSFLSHTNVIVSEIPVNKFLNEKKLNYQINFTCKKYTNAIFMDLNYSRVIPKLRHFSINLARSILKEILAVNYKQAFNKYKLTLPLPKQTTKMYRDIGTQTSVLEITEECSNSYDNQINDKSAKNKSDNSVNSNNLFRL